MSSSSRLAVFVAGTAILTAALTACGSDDSSSSDASAATTTVVAGATGSTSTPSTGAQATSSAASSPEATTIPPKPARGTVDPARFASSEQGTAAYYFYSPTLNVGCGIYVGGAQPDGVGCQALTSVPSAAGPTCKNGGDSLYGISIASGRATSTCFSQGIYFGMDKAKVLPYGQSIVVGSRSCTSTTLGMTCYDGPAGFTLARDRNETY